MSSVLVVLYCRKGFPSLRAGIIRSFLYRTVQFGSLALSTIPVHLNFTKALNSSVDGRTIRGRKKQKVPDSSKIAAAPCDGFADKRIKKEVKLRAKTEAKCKRGRSEVSSVVASFKNGGAYNQVELTELSEDLSKTIPVDAVAQENTVKTLRRVRCSKDNAEDLGKGSHEAVSSWEAASKTKRSKRVKNEAFPGDCVAIESTTRTRRRRNVCKEELERKDGSVGLWRFLVGLNDTPQMKAKYMGIIEKIKLKTEGKAACDIDASEVIKCDEMVREMRTTQAAIDADSGRSIAGGGIKEEQVNTVQFARGRNSAEQNTGKAKREVMRRKVADLTDVKVESETKRDSAKQSGGTQNAGLATSNDSLAQGRRTKVKRTKKKTAGDRTAEKIIEEHEEVLKVTQSSTSKVDKAVKGKAGKLAGLVVARAKDGTGREIDNLKEMGKGSREALPSSREAATTTRRVKRTKDEELTDDDGIVVEDSTRTKRRYVKRSAKSTPSLKRGVNSRKPRTKTTSKDTVANEVDDNSKLVMELTQSKLASFPFDGSAKHCLKEFKLSVLKTGQGRFYKLEMEDCICVLPSVTTVLGNTLDSKRTGGLLGWNIHQIKKYGRKKHAANVTSILNAGSFFHENVENKLKEDMIKEGKLVPPSPKEESAKETGSDLKLTPLREEQTSADPLKEEGDLKKVPSPEKKLILTTRKTKSSEKSGNSIPSELAVLPDPWSSPPITPDSVSIVEAFPATGFVTEYPDECLFIEDYRAAEPTVSSSHLGSSNKATSNMKSGSSEAKEKVFTDDETARMKEEASECLFIEDYRAAEPTVSSSHLGSSNKATSKMKSGSSEAKEKVFTDKERARMKEEATLLMQSVSHVLDDVSDVQVLETKVIHYELGYTGTCDCVARYKGQLCVIDWKTSRKKKSALADCYDYPLQLVAYSGAINHNPNMFDFKIRHILLVIAYTDGSPADVHHVDHAMCLNLWPAWLNRLHKYQIMFPSDLSGIFG